MKIAVVRLDKRTDVHRELKSLAVKHPLTSDPVFAHKSGERYMIVGVEHG